MKLPQQMQVARAEAQGPAAQLRLQSVPVPQPGPGQVLIRVESASVNFSDVKRRRGDAYPFPTAFPYVPGGEVAGTVAALGAGVDGPAVGTPVFALVGGDGQGGYAQFALAFAPQVSPLPPGLSPDVACGLLVAGTTAVLLLSQAARLQPGETVLVPSAAGGVGHYAVQVARAMGAGQVVATVGEARKAAAATAAGAHTCVVTRAADWPEQVLAATGGKGVDVLLEASGGPSLAEGLRALAPFGRAVVYGAASGQAAVLDAAAIEHAFYNPAPNQSITAFNLGGWFMGRPDAAGAAVGQLTGWVMGGQVTPPPVEALPLAGAAAAHDRLEKRQATGKIVLKPWQA